MKIFAGFNEKLAKERACVGLDIGTSALKFVKLRFLNDSVELYNFAVEPTAADLEPVLKKIAESEDIKKINISISGPAVVLRYISFPKMNPEELRQSLKFEAQKNIPFAIQEVNLDGAILKSDLPENKMLVLLAAAKKEFLSQRLKLFEGVGLNIGVVDVDSVALVNAFNFNYSQEEGLKAKTIALLNIGASFSNLNILEDGIPRLSRDIPVAGNTFTQKVGEAFGANYKTAEGIKLNPDKEKLEKISAAIESALGNLASEVRTSFDYYESQSTASVTKIYLSGAGSWLTGLKESLVSLLGVEVEYWDCLKQISISDELQQSKLKQLSGQFAVAVGAALRG